MTLSVAEALATARARGLAPLDAQLLLARVLATTRSGLITGDDRRLGRAELARWSIWLERRLAGEPIAYLLGEKEFHGLLLEVNADVLVPRPDTELLVDWAAACVPGTASRGDGAAGTPTRVVDLGTGSGAIALALKKLRPGVQLTGIDASASALAVARRNAARLGLEVEWLQSSWWDGLAGRRFEIAVANPPYVGEHDAHLHALRHEPAVALIAGADGLVALRSIVAGAADRLAPGGWLLLEHGFDQAQAVRELLGGAGFVDIETRRDLSGQERATGGRQRPI